LIFHTLVGAEGTKTCGSTELGSPLATPAESEVPGVEINSYL
jgi:hypothetical protein